MTYTKEQVMAIIGKNTRLFKSARNTRACSCVYREDGTRLGLCLACYGEGLHIKEKGQNRLRAEQRKRLENTKPKKTREVITNC